ncbi:MAG: deoxyribodipyrimidine photolyase [Flavobacteriales bacterium]|nr:deoxyribodipyrimidine photolyase [Flavobacteriales bacterium]|tara:strand:+ start:18755 stop:19855 length:1101 start_codon:yes stop_codon:yes gene_type:complete
MIFSTSISDIWERIDKIDPIKYSSTRNYENGAVSYLSPYISRGIIQSKDIINALIEKGYKSYQFAKFEQELAWREFWQRIWQKNNLKIYSDFKHVQNPVDSWDSPAFLEDSSSGINAIDRCITSLKQDGYMHNHMRMYLSSLVCNIGRFHWKKPADWMYYYLLDGDVASNYLSWQWVAGSNASKKYIANQKNINTFFNDNQNQTILDKSYEAIEQAIYNHKYHFDDSMLVLKTKLPESTKTHGQGEKIRLYNYYNLDPTWRKDDDSIPILLLEPSVFKKHPIGENALNFMLKFNQENLNAEIFNGEFHDLIKLFSPSEIFYKEHPLNGNYKGIEDQRNWMYEDLGKYSSFFNFWKKIKKQKNEKRS